MVFILTGSFFNLSEGEARFEEIRDWLRSIGRRRFEGKRLEDL